MSDTRRPLLETSVRLVGALVVVVLLLLAGLTLGEHVESSQGSAIPATTHLHAQVPVSPTTTSTTPPVTTTSIPPVTATPPTTAPPFTGNATVPVDVASPGNDPLRHRLAGRPFHNHHHVGGDGIQI